MAERILPLRVRGLRFSAGGRRLLDDIDLDVTPGERLVVMGPNGAGKSLLLRVCHGLVQPEAGHIEWAADASLARRRQAMVFQRPVLLRRRALENVELGLRLAGEARATCRARALEALEMVGLPHLAQRPARVLSGGEQQRLVLARAAAMSPELLWMDEPTASLDPRATLDIERTIRALNARGTTVVMTTHDAGQARRLGTRVLLVVAGRIVEDAPAGRFFDAPATDAARRFLQGELLV